MEPDEYALLASNKALVVIFIIMISVINLVLIVKQVRKPKFYLNVKAMIIFSLAIGDLLVALLPLVLKAQILYASDLHLLTFSTTIALYIYGDFLIHFVYGIGLVTLGTEVLLRHRIYTINIHKGIIALFASAVPWILGLVIILPLTLANEDFQYLSMLGVAVLFPASLAVLVTAILNCVSFTLENNQFANSNQSQVVYQPQPQQPGVQQHNNPFANNEQSAKQVHVNGQGVYQYASNPPSSRSQQQTANIHIESNQTTNTAVILTAAISTSNRKTEVQRLLVIAILFFIMVVPMAGVDINLHTIVWPDTMTAVVVTKLLYWVMVFRSFLTPLIMLSYSDL